MMSSIIKRVKRTARKLYTIRSIPIQIKLIGKFLSYVTNMIVTIVNVIIFLNIPTNEN